LKELILCSLFDISGHDIRVKGIEFVIDVAPARDYTGPLQPIAQPRTNVLSRLNPSRIGPTALQLDAVRLERLREAQGCVPAPEVAKRRGV